jgi:hypothetical protein
MKFKLDDIQILVLMHYVMIMLMVIIFFKIVKCSWKLKKYLDLVFILSCHKNKVNRKMEVCCQVRVLNNPYKIIGVHLYKYAIMKSLHIHGFDNLFDYWGPNWSLEKFKMNENFICSCF